MLVGEVLALELILELGVEDLLEEVCVKTVEGGQMTKDLALLVGRETPWLTTQEFLSSIEERLSNEMA